MTAALLLPLLLGVADPADVGAWPAFNGGGKLAADADPPVEWDGPDNQNIAWTAPIPDGQSSPVIVGETVYATGVVGENKEQNVVVAVNLADGAEQWRFEAENSFPKKSSLYVSRAAPTPCADDGGVYALFESGDLYGLSPAGELTWERKLSDEYGKPQNQFQLGGSPAQTDDALFVPFTDEGPSYLLAVEKTTGENRWKVALEPSTSYSTPLVYGDGGNEQVILSYNGAVVSYDPADGSENWRFTDLGGNSIATPTPVPGMDDVILIGANAGGPSQADAGQAIRSNLALRIPAKKGGEPEVLWRAEKVMTGFASPLAYDGRTYWIEQNGVLQCLAAADGAQLFRARLPQDSWATPLAAGGKLYFFGKDGVTAVLDPADDYELAAENVLYDKAPARGPGFGGDIQYGAAPAGDTLVIRVNEKLVAVRK